VSRSNERAQQGIGTGPVVAVRHGQR